MASKSKQMKEIARSIRKGGVTGIAASHEKSTKHDVDKMKIDESDINDDSGIGPLLDLDDPVVDDVVDEKIDEKVDETTEDIADAVSENLTKKIEARKSRASGLGEGNLLTSVSSIAMIGALFPSLVGLSAAAGGAISSVGKMRKKRIDKSIEKLEAIQKDIDGDVEPASSSGDGDGPSGMLLESIDGKMSIVVERLDAIAEKLGVAQRLHSEESDKSIEDETEAKRAERNARARAFRSKESGAISPKVGIIAGIVSLAMLGLVKYQKEIGEFVGKIKDRFKGVVEVFGHVGNFLVDFGDTVARMGTRMWTFITADFPQMLTSVAGKIGDAFMAMVNRVKNWLDGGRRYRKDDFVPQFADDEYRKQMFDLRLKEEKLKNTRMNGRKRNKEIKAIQDAKAALNEKYDTEPQGSPGAAATTQGSPGAVIEPIVNLELGRVSKKYESGSMGVASISSGKDDPGGVSYGTYQLASNTGTMADFLKNEGKDLARAHGLDRFEPGSPEFNKRYSIAAKLDKDKMEQAQHEYIKRTHYEPVKRQAEMMGFDTSDRKVQEALFSQSVQHSKGGNMAILSAASSGGSAQDQVNSIYEARREYVIGLKKVPQVTKNRILNRYKRELKDVSSLPSSSYRSTALDSTVSANQMAKASASSVPPVVIQQGDTKVSSGSGLSGGAPSAPTTYDGMGDPSVMRAFDTLQIRAGVL